MNWFLFVALCFFDNNLATHTSEIKISFSLPQVTPNDSAFVILYRPKRHAGSLTAARINLYNQIIFLKNNSVKKLKVPFGEINIVNTRKLLARKRMPLHLVLEANKKYYLRYNIVNPFMSLSGGRDYFELVDEKKALDEIQKIKKKN